MEYKGYEIKTELGSLLKITTVGSGSIPTALTGLWSSMAEAKKAIDSYKAIPKRGKSNADKSDRGV